MNAVRSRLAWFLLNRARPGQRPQRPLWHLARLVAPR